MSNIDERLIKLAENTLAKNKGSFLTRRGVELKVGGNNVILIASKYLKDALAAKEQAESAPPVVVEPVPVVEPVVESVVETTTPEVQEETPAKPAPKKRGRRPGTAKKTTKVATE